MPFIGPWRVSLPLDRTHNECDQAAYSQLAGSVGLCVARRNTRPSDAVEIYALLQETLSVVNRKRHMSGFQGIRLRPDANSRSSSTRFHDIPESIDQGH
jgi:hypothetical protein